MAVVPAWEMSAGLLQDWERRHRRGGASRARSPRIGGAVI